MSTIAERAEEVRMRLMEQAKDPIDYGDYKDQLRAYQSIINETLKAVRDLALEVEKKA